MSKEHEMDIYKHNENLWSIQTKNDRLLIHLHEGKLEFYRSANEEIGDIS